MFVLRHQIENGPRGRGRVGTGVRKRSRSVTGSTKDDVKEETSMSKEDSPCGREGGVRGRVEDVYMGSLWME